MHKAGFVNIIGKPNVGKSSLMNTLTGYKLSAVSYKAQTTRHRIFGIINTDAYQIVFSDTPGLIKPAYLMHECMMSNINEALKDADVFMLMTDVNDNFHFEEIIHKMQKTEIPVIVAINKCDLSNQENVQKLIGWWKEKLPQANVIPISVLENFNLQKILDTIINFLPEHEAYYPKDDITNLPLRFFTAEIIREKIFLHYEKEIPYAVEVVIESYEDTEDIARIRAVIFVERQTQKGIIIGQKGDAIKNIGIKARHDIETLAGKKVFLELHVKVLKNWRSEKNLLKKLGHL